MGDTISYKSADLYKSRTVEVLTHIAVWVVALSLPFLLDTHHGMHNVDDNWARKFHYLNFLTNVLWIAPFYLNAYLLTPRLFYSRRYIMYSLVILLLFAILLLINYVLYSCTFNPADYKLKGAMGFMLPAFALTIAISTTFRVVRDKLKADQKQQEQQKENLKTELSFLRSQINPHFIFNILNNLVALEQLKSPELGPTILKLAALMQYMLYETDEDRVDLAQEAEYLQSFIDLQRQRFGQKVAVTVALDKTDSFFEIEPMLLIPFVENAFKHGMGLIQNPAIDVSLAIENGTLLFSVKNRFNPASIEIKDKTSGIGLANVKRRLELLYGDSQTLKITRDGEWFSVLLTLKLH